MSREEDLTQAAAELPGIRLVVLFGSLARGMSRARSDVDVGVLLESSTPGLKQDVETALGRAAGRELDMIDLEDAPLQLRFEIAREGRLLLERTPHAWADFRARAMIEWWDWAPTARMIHAAAARRVRERATDGAP